MSSTLTYRYRLLLTKQQRLLLECILEAQRQLYNAALQERIECYRKTGKSRSYFNQCVDLTICRRDLPEMAALPANLQRWTLKRLDEAFAGFFSRVKAKADRAAAEEDLSFATGREGLRRLARLLDQEPLWRNKRLFWNFGEVLEHHPDCGSRGCALGLAQVMWPEFAEAVHARLGGSFAAAEHIFGIDHHASLDLFGWGLRRTVYGEDWDEMDLEDDSIEPHQVATAIRDYLAKSA